MYTSHKNDKVEFGQYNISTNSHYDYMTEKNVRENNSACYHETNGSGASFLSRPMMGKLLDLGIKTEIESTVQNRHLELSSNKRYNKDHEKFKTVHPDTCDLKKNMTNEDSRFTTPIVHNREMYTANYKFTPCLHYDVQSVFATNDMRMSPHQIGGSSSRYDGKKEQFLWKPKDYASPKNRKNHISHTGYMPTQKAVDTVKAYDFIQ